MEPGSLRWDKSLNGGEGAFRFTFKKGSEDTLASDPRFANGVLGLLHTGEVGSPNVDYRSWTSSLAPFSLQITSGRNGVYADIDRFNPYALAGMIQHATLEVLPFWKRPWQ
jgi:hypothetical protein